MDWGHLTLGGAVVALVALWIVRRRSRTLHIRVDWEEKPDGDTGRHRQRRDRNG